VPASSISSAAVYLLDLVDYQVKISVQKGAFRILELLELANGHCLLVTQNLCFGPDDLYRGLWLPFRHLLINLDVLQLPAGRPEIPDGLMTHF
jgi:hypothetical protein